MAEFHEVVVVGGGQAGLVASHKLTERGVDHVVLEAARVAERWRTARWDSLRFQFPNTVLGLPGMPYDGEDTDGFAHHDEVASWLERYAALVNAPVREQTPVNSLDHHGERWKLQTEGGEIRARAVVLATGPFQKARMPVQSVAMPTDVAQLHSLDYRRPELLPDGAVLVVGSGASGAQIAEELVTAGRMTYLCVSRHRRVPRRFLGRDVFTWLVQTGLMDRTRADWVDGRMPPTVLVTGIDGGHDLNLRELERQGARLLGSLRGVTEGQVKLADDAETILAAADAMCEETIRTITRHAAEQGLDVPAPEPPAKLNVRARPTTLPLHDLGIRSVIWATGYSFDYNWVHAPCFDATGQPIQRRGVGPVEGLYFLGLHWMHTFKSGTFLGIGDDADHVIHHLVGQTLRR